MIVNILQQTTKKYPHRKALCFDKVSLTYRELLDLSLSLAGELKEKGLQKGDYVLLIMENSIEFIAAFFAVNSCGGVIVPLYPRTGLTKIKKIIDHYQIDLIITQEKLKKGFDSIHEEKNLLGVLFLNFTGTGNSLLFSCSPGKMKKKDVPGPENARPVPAIILFSSGTTNIPKGIMLSNRNIETNVAAISNYLRPVPEDKVLLIKNINHASSITGEMLVSFFNGCTLIMTAGFPTASSIMDLIRVKSVTIFFAVPTILSAILSHKDFEKYDLSSLRIINFYGANMPFEKIKEMSRRFKKVNLIYSYGLTEASPRVTFITRDDLLKKPGSSGKPVDGVQVDILNGEGKRVPEYTRGEIVVRGPNVMIGYYGNEELTRKVLKGGMLRTGDLGYLDSGGFLYVTGRNDNMVTRAGKNIYPEEIECVITGYDKVCETLVRGEEDPLLGYEIAAYVVPGKQGDISTREILSHCRNHLEDYKIPGKIFIIKELKKTISGKIIRKQIISPESEPVPSTKEIPE